MERKRNPGSGIRRFSRSALRSIRLQDRALPDGQNTQPLGQSTNARIFHFTEIRKRRMCCPTRFFLEGRSYVVTMREPGLRWTRQRRHEMGRAGRVVPVSSNPACRRAALPGFVSSVSFRPRRQGRENCGEMAGRAYGKTVWSWPSLLRSSFRGGVCEPNRADSIIQIREAREARTNSAPGRARHKPSDHRAGKAE